MRWRSQHGKEVDTFDRIEMSKPAERIFDALGAGKSVCAARSWRKSANGGWRAGWLGAMEDSTVVGESSLEAEGQSVFLVFQRSVS